MVANPSGRTSHRPVRARVRVRPVRGGDAVQIAIACEISTLARAAAIVESGRVSLRTWVMRFTDWDLEYLGGEHGGRVLASAAVPLWRNPATLGHGKPDVVTRQARHNDR